MALRATHEVSGASVTPWAGPRSGTPVHAATTSQAPTIARRCRIANTSS
jgi:hypothetical protein